VIMGIGMQLVEVGPAVLSSPNRFPVHDDGADPKREKRVDNPRILPGPIVTPPGEQPNPVAVLSGN
jgi:hypothetical protein